MKKNVFVLMMASGLLFACSGEAEVEASDEVEVTTEVMEKLETEQELNGQVHELHDDLDELLESL